MVNAKGAKVIDNNKRIIVEFRKNKTKQNTKIKIRWQVSRQTPLNSGRSQIHFVDWDLEIRNNNRITIP